MWFLFVHGLLRVFAFCIAQESLERRQQFEADSLARLNKASQKYLDLMLQPDQVQRASTQTMKRLGSGRKDSVSKYEVGVDAGLESVSVIV